MKKTFILLPLVAALFYVTLSSYMAGPATMGIEGTGASGSTSYCSGPTCHASAPTTSTSVSIQVLSGATTVTSYVPGNTYTIILTGTNTGLTNLPKFGFQLAVVKAATTTNAGTLSAPTGGHTGTASGINLVEHSSPLAPTSGTGSTGTVYGISITWVAPAAGTGSVTIYGVLNAVNNSLTADAGDLWNHTTATLTEVTASSISGPSSVCVGSTITLTTGASASTWTSSNTAVATIGASTGVVTGVTAGTTTISYGTAGTVITVNPSPAPITGTTTVCEGATTTLSETSTGGFWLTGAVGTATVGSSSGIVTGVSAGTTLITYGFFPSLCNVTTMVTVNPGATPPAITGSSTLCVGTTLSLADTRTGGTWSSSGSGATVSSGGVVSGVSVGTVTISYTTTNGCGTGSALKTVTVNAASACNNAVGSVAGLQQGLSISPNPNSGSFTLNLLADNNEAAHVTITNLVGDKVKEFTIATNTSADVRLNVPAGLYFIRATTEHKKYAAKIVVQ